MDCDKKFLNYDEQLDLLESRGLSIGNRDGAKRLLLTHPYYDIVNRYKNHFMRPDNTFKPNTSILDLFGALIFDRELQSIVLRYSVLVESIFKNKFAYAISQYIGVNEKDYLSKYHYNENVRNSSLSFSEISQNIDKWLMSKKPNNPTRYYKEHHNHIPAWILFYNLSWSNVINLFRYMKSDEDAKRQTVEALIPAYGTYDQKVDFAISALNTIKTFRNCAAHNLKFADLRMQGKKRASPEMMYHLAGPILIKKKDKKIISSDKNALAGVYGCIILMFILLNDSAFQSKFLIESVPELYDIYSKISDLPEDLPSRFESQFPITDASD